MIGRSRVRQSAALWRDALLGGSAASCVPAGVLIPRALERAGVSVSRLPHGDPLLAGAVAVLDRDAATIWLDRDAAPADESFVVAHEIAHVALHGATEAAPAFDGYSPLQRREADADTWAREFLLPSDLAWNLFASERLAASEIAARAGIDARHVRRQLRDRMALGQAVAGGSAQESLGLSASQRAAAVVERGPFFLNAGPGTGKTSALLGRIEHLVRERGVAPQSILALTFSRRAAGELRERLEATGITPAGDTPWVGTLHAFCLETLRRFSDEAALPERWSLASGEEVAGLIERALAGSDGRRAALAGASLPLADMLAAISRAKDDLVDPRLFHEQVEARAVANAGKFSPDALRGLRDIARFYPIYEQILARAGRLDFGDLGIRAARLLESSEAVRDRLRAQYPHLLADEYQDVNASFRKLIRLLAGAGEGLWVVGDHRQSIYQFRGASSIAAADFQREFSGAVVATLTHNYRSDPRVTALASEIAGKLDAARPGRFAPLSAARDRAERSATAGVTLAVADDQDAQVGGIADGIRRNSADGTPFCDQAVLCRTRAQAAAMRAALAAEGLPLAAPAAASLGEVEKDLICLIDAASGGSVSGQLARRRVDRLFSSPGAADRALADLARAASPAALLEAFLFDGQCYARVLSGSKESMRDAARVLSAAEEAQRSYRRDVAADEDGKLESPLAWFLRKAVRAANGSTSNDAGFGGGDGVRVMTIHAAKGLEFSAVFVPNLADGQFPLRSRRLAAQRDLLGDADLSAREAEEANLFFVAVSRARDSVVLSRAERPDPSVARPMPQSPLLGLARATLADRATRHARWPSRNKTPLSPEAGAPETAASVTASRLDTYIECPRRAFYSALSEAQPLQAVDDRSDYRALVRDTAAWIERERTEGRAPSEQDVARRLGRRRQSGDSVPGLYDDLYARQALSALRPILHGPIIDTPRAQVALSAGCVVLDDGTTALTPGRARRYEAALQGIAARRYPALPSDERLCARCLFRFVCPE